MGPNANVNNYPYFGSNFWEPWSKWSRMEFFDADQNKQFENVSVNPVKFEHLDNTMQEKVLDELDYEIGFYNKCIDLH